MGSPARSPRSSWTLATEIGAVSSRVTCRRGSEDPDGVLDELGETWLNTLARDTRDRATKPIDCCQYALVYPDGLHRWEEGSEARAVSLGMRNIADTRRCAIRQSAEPHCALDRRNQIQQRYAAPEGKVHWVRFDNPAQHGVGEYTTHGAHVREVPPLSAVAR